MTVQEEEKNIGTAAAKPTEPSKVKDSSKEPMNTAQLVSFAYQVGYSIIIPIIIFVLGGRFIDKKLNSSPIGILSGLVLSFIITSFIIMKKVKEITKDL